jgi:hypothetical protein
MFFLLAAIAMAAVGVYASARSTSAAGHSITTPVPAALFSGDHASLELDADGKPVIGYYDPINLDVRIIHCGDADCASGNISTAPDPTGNDVGRYLSLELDPAGNPVVSYQDHTSDDLKVLHCGNANCTSSNVFHTPDTDGVAGIGTSLKLDTGGNPVIAEIGGGELRIVHCGTSTCGSGNSIASPVDSGSQPLEPSLALDAAGYPVVSFYSSATHSLALLHCGDVNCTAGGSVVTLDSSGGRYSSLALSGAGNPVIAYFDVADARLRVMHCGNPNCTAGDVIAQPEAINTDSISLQLDELGYPVVAYHDQGNQTLKVLHCRNADCTALGNPIYAPDPLGNASNDVGLFASLALDAQGYPVVAYKYNNAAQLRVLHCGNQTCGPKKSVATPGDANCDGAVNAIDAAVVLQYSAGLIKAPGCEVNADVNGSRSVNSLDAALILQYVAGLIHSLPSS